MYKIIKAVDVNTGSFVTVPGKEGLPTAKDFLALALRSVHESDRANSFEEKLGRFNLLEKISLPDMQDYTPAERDILRDRVGKIIDHIEVLGQLNRLLV